MFAININSFDIISGYVEFDLCTLDRVRSNLHIYLEHIKKPRAMRLPCLPYIL